MNNSFPIYPFAALVLTVLKLTGAITISWWWVLLPLWIWPVVVGVAFSIPVVLAFLTLCVLWVASFFTGRRK